MSKLKGKSGILTVFIIELIVGILLLINPTGFTTTILVIAGIILLISGVCSIIKYFKTEPLESAIEESLSMGLIMACLGLFCILKSDWFITTFSILSTLYGIGLLVSGFEKIQWTVDSLRLKVQNWWVIAISAVLSIIFAMIIIKNPFSTSTVLWNFIGVILIVEAILDVISVIFGKNEIEKSEE